MSIINLNIINIFKVTREEQRVTPQLLPLSNQQQDITQQPNILQYISPTTPVNTQPIYQLIESTLTSTESSTNKRQLDSKRKEIDPPESEEEVNTTDDANNQDMVMEDQKNIQPNPNKNINKVFNTRNQG